MRIRALAAAAAAVGVLGAVPAGAMAAGTPAGLVPTSTTSTTPTTTTPAPTPTPSSPTTPTATTTSPAVKGHGKLYLGGLITVRGTAVGVPGRDVRVSGVVTPWRPGQRVSVEAIEAGHVLARHTVTLKPSAKSIYGSFAITFPAPRAGLMAIKLVHRRSSALTGFSAERHVQVLSEAVGPGARGLFVDLLQSRLAAAHVYLPQTGVFDAGTEMALDTYHRVLGEGEGHTQVDAATVTDLLAGRGAFHVRFPRQGYHAEGDLSDQVLAYINGSRVQYLLPISSGKPSTPTVLGEYQVYRKQPNYLPDGMYFSNFFTGGYAIHGYDPAPAYPASHGCMRIPISDAIFAYNLLNIGDWVDTYYT